VALAQIQTTELGELTVVTEALHIAGFRKDDQGYDRADPGEVRRMTRDWLVRYNEQRPNKSLGDLSPRQYLMANSP